MVKSEELGCVIPAKAGIQDERIRIIYWLLIL